MQALNATVVNASLIPNAGQFRSLLWQRTSAKVSAAQGTVDLIQIIVVTNVLVFSKRLPATINKLPLTLSLFRIKVGTHWTP